MRDSESVLSHDVRAEISNLIAQELGAYFSYEYDTWDQEPGPETTAPSNIDGDINESIAKATASASTHGEDMEACNEPDVVRECLAEISMTPRGGEPVPENMSQVINNAFTVRLADEIRASKLKLFPTPANCHGSDKVRINQPIWDKLKPHTRSMDARMQVVQSHVVAAGAGVCKALPNIQNMAPEKIKDPSITQLTKALLKVQVLLGQSNVELNLRRRKLVKLDLNAQFHHLCAATTPVSQWLFGDELSSQVKNISDANRVVGRIFPVSGRGRPFRGRRNFRYRPYSQRAGFRGRGSGSRYGGRRPDYENASQSSRRTMKSEAGEQSEVRVPLTGGRLAYFVSRWLT